MKSMSVNLNATNVVKFGKFVISLEKEQLHYYMYGELVKVVDVNFEFTNKDLYELATKISRTNGYGPVEYTTKELAIKNR